MSYISRQAAIDIERNATVDTNPSHFEAHQKFKQFMDDAEISSFGRWEWSNGFNTALTAVGIDLKKLPSAQPEPCEDAVSREAAIRCCTFGRTSLGLADELRRLPSVTPKQRWIPCSERLPKKDGRYLCFWDFGDGLIDYKVLFYMTEKDELFDKGWNAVDDMFNGLVDWSDSMKAWMPLPEPYKEKP